MLERGWLLNEVWGFDFPTTANSLEVYIGYLRRKTEGEGETPTDPHRPRHRLRAARDAPVKPWLTPVLGAFAQPVPCRTAWPSWWRSAVAPPSRSPAWRPGCITNVTVYNQLDSELIDVAAVTADWVAVDIEGMGGLDNNALRAANVTVMLVRADGPSPPRLPGERLDLVSGPEELSVARRQQGSSARTGDGRRTGQPYRIVAVPVQSATRTTRWCWAVRWRRPTTS